MSLALDQLPKKIAQFLVSSWCTGVHLKIIAGNKTEHPESAGGNSLSTSEMVDKWCTKPDTYDSFILIHINSY